MNTSADFCLSTPLSAWLAADIFTPTMSGAGGNKVVSLPNKMSIVVLGRDDYNASVPDDKLAALVVSVLSSKN